MNWLPRLDTIFSFNKPVAIVLSILFLIPALRLILLPFAFERRLAVRLSSLCGRLEYIVGWIRNGLAVPYLVAGVGWNAYRWLGTWSERTWNDFAAYGVGALALIVLNELFRSWKRESLINLLEFVRRYPQVHPQDFFTYYYAAHGCARCHLPGEPHRSINPLNVDFRGANQKLMLTAGRYLRGLRDATIIMKLVILAEKCRGREYAREVGSSIALVTSTREIQWMRAQILIEGIEKLKNIDMPIIYCLNHTSVVDFTILPTLIAAHKGTAGIDITNAPCFLLARDHFLENPFLYRLIGIGRAAEIFGMIFVERKRKSKAKAQEVSTKAVQKLLSGNTPLAIYPQGSRARGKKSADGARLDAGYYTVGPLPRLEKEGGHIKKGAAFIATDTALEMLKRTMSGQVNVVPVAFIGAANVVPRESIRIQTGLTVMMRVGDPIIITPEMVEHCKLEDDPDAYRDFVQSLHQRIDQALKSTFRVHADLECRFFEDIRGVIDPLRMEELAIAIKQWRREDYLVYVLLDFIYALPAKEWRSLLGQLAHLILTDAPRDDFVAFQKKLARMLSA